MERAIVIGCPGAGKSVFSRKLRDVSGLPLFYLDMIWHRPDKTNVPREAFDAALAKILREERWIIDGNYLRTMPLRLARCDTVFFFDLPLSQCLEGARARVGAEREDLPWKEESFDAEFCAEILAFGKEQKPQILSLLKSSGGGRKVVTFRSRAEADRFIEDLRRK